jgi:hypothetical protein
MCVFFVGFFLFFDGSIKNTILLLENKEEFCWTYDKYVVVFLFFGSCGSTDSNFFCFKPQNDTGTRKIVI